MSVTSSGDVSSFRPLLSWRWPSSASDGSVSIRPVEKADTLELAELCTDCFFGVHEWTDGPVIFAQRLFYFAGVYRQLVRRISFEEGRECKLLVASSPTGICGCVDLAVHLYDLKERRMELTKDTMPASGKYAWRPYIASLAVRSDKRRRGVARRLMKEAERLARGWGYREILLEVTQLNVAAIRFYKKVGYRILRSDEPGVGATQVDVRGFYWDVYLVPKYVMKKQL